ncbi:protein FAR1-RELATED SEQUENCE 5-like [Silene latifolia]|uniref:protein FAR1-RELATED SEQUENCE 5-like n=1 Tax=Silene latifolia TaxID=37657 RepID=UPI003D772386
MSTSDATTSSSTNNSFKTPRTRIETINELHHIPFCPEEKQPKVGQARCKGKRTDTADNDAQSDVTDINRVRPITRIDCRALVQFKYQDNGTYIVIRFDEAHNHPLALPESTIFLKGNRKMTEVDFKNFVRDIKTYIGNFDAQMFVENLIGKKDTCSSFYLDFIVDENKCLAGVFWADPICIKNYMLFGEVLSADATYETNKYDMVFVPFTGVDHHKRCITFGAGLIGDESIECYTWLFKTFLEAMGGCQPRIIITDQDKSMKSVVPEVFKESTHRLCMWHIMKKLREKVSYQLFQDEDLKTRLNRCVWNNQHEPDEFEEQWGKIMTDYQLVEHEWFSDLYDLREQWIPAYFKDVSMSGLMRVTSKSESENNFFDREWACCAGTAFGFYTTNIFEKILTRHNAKMDKSSMSKPVFDKDGKSIDVSQKFSTGKF